MALGQLAVIPHEFRVTAGDDWRLGVTLYQNGAVQDVHLATSITCAVRDGNGYRVVDAVAQSSATTGADWTNGLVVLAIAGTSNQALVREAEYYLEVTVTDAAGLKTTWPWIPLIVVLAGV